MWISDIVASFSQAGSAIGGQSQLGPSDPSSVFSCGTDIANAMLQSISQNNVGITLGNILPAVEACFAALICALGVVLAFAIIAGQLLITLSESYIVIGAGVFMLGFTGSRWTLVFGEKYVGYAFSVGIKLFMLELIVGLGYGLGQQWAALFANGIAPPETYIEVVGAALIFGFLAWQVPSLAGSLMNGAPRMTLGVSSTPPVRSRSAVLWWAVVSAASSPARAHSRPAGAPIRCAPPERPVTRTIRPRSRPAGRVTAQTGAAPATLARRTITSLMRGMSPTTLQLARHRKNEFDAENVRESDASAASAQSESSATEADATTEHAGQSYESTDADVTTEDAAQTRTSDAAVADEDEQMARRAEQRDVQSGNATPSAPGVNPAQAFRQPPIPDDSADDGGIHIRFNHPE